MVKVYSVRVGDKYGPEYEEYLRSKIPNIEFINKTEHPFLRQWNKLRFMNLDVDEPICVIDIDIELTNDFMELFEYPIKPGEFVSIPSWWKDTWCEDYTLNGGFYKYYPKDCKYIYDKFIKDPQKWTTHYVENGITVGPINGEQYFVEDSVKERLNLTLVPEDWVQRGVDGQYLDDGYVKFVHHSWRNK